jgi:hypothetical protein
MPKYTSEFKLSMGYKVLILEALKAELEKAAQYGAGTGEEERWRSLHQRVQGQLNVFVFNTFDIANIEYAVHNRISHLAEVNLEPDRLALDRALSYRSNAQIAELHRMLGAIHNQKTWYGQVNRGENSGCFVCG